MRNRVETAWIMAEIEPYSFEPMRDSSKSEEDDVHESQDERRIHRGVYASVVRTEKGNKRKIEKEFLCCKEIEEAVCKISGQ